MCSAVCTCQRWAALSTPSRVLWAPITLRPLAAHVFVEPVDRALPGQIGCRFVISFRRRVAIKAVHGTWIDVAFVRYVCGAQGLVVSRPRRCQSGVEFPL